MVLRGLRSSEYYGEVLTKLPHQEELYSKKSLDLGQAEIIFGCKRSELFDLIKSYLSISTYINDVLLAYMTTHELIIYSPFLK